MKKLNTEIKRLGIVLGIVLLSTFTSCQTEELNENEIEPVVSGSVDENLVTLNWRGKQIQVVKDGDLYLLDDIIIDGGVEVDKTNEVDGQTGLFGTGTANSTGSTDRLWPNNTVFYVLGSASNAGKRITNAIEHWEENTNLSFVQRTNEANYLDFSRRSGCSSNVGMLGGRQTVNLSDNCSQGTVIHEIGHAIGFWHEQSRSDRDDFITINFNNIKDGKENNFNKWTENNNRVSEDLTRDLDFNSRMLYASDAFSKNGKATITKKNGKTYKINETVLSKGDIEGANNLYPARVITIRASNGKYLSSEDGLRTMTVNRSSAGAWERFRVNEISKGVYVIKGSNGKYISSEGGEKPVNCNRATPQKWEKFTLEKISGNRYYIKGSNGLYMSSNDGNNKLGLTVDRSKKAKWEEFRINGL